MQKTSTIDIGSKQNYYGKGAPARSPPALTALKYDGGVHTLNLGENKARWHE